LVVGALLALGAAGVAGAGEAEDAVLAAQDQRIKLLIAGDLAKLGAAMTDDLTWTHSNANVETKAEFLDAVKTGKYKYKAMTFDDRRVRLHGDSAIVSGTTRVQVESGGRDLDIRLRFTELYVKDKGGWKMALWQSTRVPD
jgi:ketosteroid isomerase-like protein